jgi:puromycin-sensitive aminopeptidase
VPDFEAGAMENAGAVFFRETLLLADPAAISLAEHKALAEVITHELAHMWYGNLVTMAWWDDLWLNEAFATWMAFRIVDEWRPQWKVWNTFEHHRAAALNLDALANTHPVYCPVRNVSEATENFDVITYEKGAAVVRMLEGYLGPEAFREGVRTYIRRHREGNATAADLWRALTEASGTPVGRIARRWTERPGFPLLTVSADATTGRAALTVRQERFYADPGTRDATRAHWPVPWVVRYRSRGTTGSVLTRYLIESPTSAVPLDGAGPLDWYYGNANEGGFFRVRHDEENLRRLTQALPAALSPVERMGLLGNQWALVRSARASIESFLDVADGFDRETDHDVLERLATALAFIDDQLLDPDDGPVRAAFRGWLERRFMPQLVQLGWDPRPAEPDASKLRRAAIIRILGEIACVPTVCSTASARAARYIQDRRSLDANLVDTTVLVGARLGDTTRFDRYRAAVAEAPTPQDRRRFQLALAEFRAPDLIERALELTLTDAVPTQDVAALLVRAIGNRAARERTWRFITRRWGRLRSRLPPMMVSRLIDALPALQTPGFKREFAAFFRAHPVPTAARAVKQALERFDLNYELRQRAAPGLSTWLTSR